MIIIPEIKTVVILVPRTGSGSLRRAIAETYPNSMLVYRHMEADGVPAGYDRWRRIGVVRHPVDRLWSLYKFLRSFSGNHDPAYIEAMRRQVNRPFDDWLLNNETVFTSPYDTAGLGRYWPEYTVRHALPENRKSQFLYLRPDLGTEVYRYGDLGRLALHLEVTLGRTNVTPADTAPVLSPTAQTHIKHCFAWDLAAVDAMEKAA
jgi:hypothetical protein